jgi:diacylglycerol kinase family enzyme
MGLQPRRALFVLLNSDAGSLAGLAPAQVEVRVREAFAAAGTAVSTRLCAAGELGPRTREAVAQGAAVVAVGGGDGSLGAAAAELAGGPVPLGVLPLGTLNHFARDLGIPADLGAAARVAAGGRVAELDLGEVNGRVFLNNSSIGLYPELVEGREALRVRRGLGRRSAMLHTTGRLLRRYPLLTVEVMVQGRSLALRTPFVFVGNNVYELKLLELGRRSALDRGELCLYLARHQSRAALLRLLALALLGRLQQDRDFRALTATAVTINSRRSLLRVASDGEVHEMRPPICYRSRPRALRVLVPERA